VGSKKAWSLTLKIFAIASLYFLSGSVGLKLGAVSKFATFVWPPTGIALAAAITFGSEIWPGIFLGAFLVNYLTGAPLAVSAGIAIGNTLESIVAIRLLSRTGQFYKTIENFRGATAYILIAAILSPMISATLGTICLLVSHIVNIYRFPETWFAWWFGDTIGALVIAPFILVLIHEIKNFKNIRAMGEALIILFLTSFLCLTIFRNWLPQIEILHWPYFLFPLLFWSGIKFRLLGTTTLTMTIASISIWGTAQGFGFFADPDLTTSLFHLQTYIAVIALSGLAFGSIMAEWVRAESDLRQALSARNEFLSIASHELKTPITSLKMQIQMTQRRVNPRENIAPTPQKLAQALEVSSKQIDRLTNLVDQLLDVSRIEAGRLEYFFQPTNLLEVTTEIAEQFEMQLCSSKCSLLIKIDESIIGIWDRSRIEQVLVNLISNAVKYAPGKEIIIRAQIPKDASRNVVLEVEDKGVGISREEQEYLFKPFTRAANLKHLPGLGLGLFIVKKIVEAHKGKISIDSLINVGTKFIVNLPLNSN